VKLIGNAFSVYAARVLIAARFKGIELDVEPMIPRGPRAVELLALNPIGKIPVLIDGPLVLPESDTIIGYLEDTRPSPSLLPGDSRQRANARLLVRLLDSYSAPSFRPFLSNDKSGIAVALERIERALGYIDHFRIDGEFASGDAFSWADCALIPFFHAYEGLHARHKTFDSVLSRPRLLAWWSRARESTMGVYARGEIDRAVAELMGQWRAS